MQAFKQYEYILRKKIKDQLSTLGVLSAQRVNDIEKLKLMLSERKIFLLKKAQ